MTAPPITLTLSSAEKAAQFAARLGALLEPGDCVLLSGPIGAGKTHICRHLIRSRMTTPEEVPSPTYTLVQTYDTDAGEIWHADLYRLSDPAEIEELGLAEAFGRAICLVEWPDRLGPDAPPDALDLSLRPGPAEEDTRHVTLNWSAPKWGGRLKELADD